MPRFRYPQFCPVARAAEIVGERWTLLIVRELLLGPRRFSDLVAPLSGISPSVLASRLASLEARAVVARRSLPPPAAAVVYELTPHGERLERILLELGRWGIELLDARQPDDYFDPAWVELGLRMLCRTTPTPQRRFRVTVPLPEGELRLAVRGGENGASVSREITESDVSIHAESFVVMGMAMGDLDPEDAIRSGALRASGNLEALHDFPALFDKPTPTMTGD
jgi:DNA-binding HxlR family transcriptional regulator